MIVENGEWIMTGVDASDPVCLHTVEDLEKLIDEIGFLPLFGGDIPGFSVEERTETACWWSGNVEKDPWEWREVVARRGNIAYGKFFNKRAGFISARWLPVFANFRRDGYDFDARWDDGLANYRHKKIMDCFMEENEGRELFSFELKEEAGFGKGGEKGFEGIVTALQMQTYLVCRDFRQKLNKQGKGYGWAIAVYATPEHIFGSELVRADYDKDPKESEEKILQRIREYCPEATDKQIRKLLGRV